MKAERVVLPEPAILTGLAISYHRDGQDIYALATTTIGDTTVASRAYLLHGVLSMYGRQSDIDGWLVSTACRAVSDLLTKLLPEYPRLLTTEQRRYLTAFNSALTQRALVARLAKENHDEGV